MTPYELFDRLYDIVSLEYYEAFDKRCAIQEQEGLSAEFMRTDGRYEALGWVMRQIAEARNDARESEEK